LLRWTAISLAVICDVLLLFPAEKTKELPKMSEGPTAAELGSREYASIKECAEKYPSLKLGYQAVRNAVVRREIAAMKIGAEYRVDARSFDAWLASRYKVAVE
jgi:hypothetical protein